MKENEPSPERRFARLLGLPETPNGPGWRVDRVEVLGAQTVRLCLGMGRGRAALNLIFELAKTGQDAAGTAWEVRIEQDSGGSKTHHLLEAVVRRFQGKAFQEILETAGAPLPPPARPGPAFGDFPIPVFDMAAGEQRDGWGNFLGMEKFDLIMDQYLFIKKGIYSIELSDRECHYGHVPEDPRLYLFVNYPMVPFLAQALRWKSLWINPYDDKSGGEFSVDLREEDIVMGTGPKFKKMAQLAKKGAENAEAFVMPHLCTPIVIGDDMDAYGRIFEESTGRPVVHVSRANMEKRIGPLAPFFKIVKKDPDFWKAEADASAVNLLDFSPPYRDTELAPLLSGLGVKINARLLPEIDIQLLRGLLGARCSAVFKDGFWEARLRDILDDVPHPLVVAPAPYGVEGSRECCRTIAAAMDREDRFDGAWEKYWEPLRPSWDKLVAEAKGHRLAFVFSIRTLAYLNEPKRWWGLPLLSMLAEMGFGIDILVYASGAPIPLAREIASKLMENKPVSLTIFENKKQLARLLREGAFGAVYSDYYFDWRPMRAGKAVFSRRMFEQGAHGAIRTARRLLDACRTPFFTRYAKHIAVSPEWEDGL